MRYQDVILADGPLGYWPLNEVSGTTAIDYGSAPLNLTHSSVFVGNSSFPSGGRMARYASASNSFTIGNNFSTSYGSTTWTVEAWIRQDAYTLPESNGGIFGCTDTGPGVPWTIFSRTKNSTGSIEVGYREPGATFPAATVTNFLQLGRLLHFVWTQESTLTTVYQNGKLFYSTTLGIAPTSSTSTTRYIHIGAGWTGVGTNWSDDHAMAHVAYYAKALSSSRIWTHYIAGIQSIQSLEFFV